MIKVFRMIIIQAEAQLHPKIALGTPGSGITATKICWIPDYTEQIRSGFHIRKDSINIISGKNISQNNFDGLQ